MLVKPCDKLVVIGQGHLQNCHLYLKKTWGVYPVRPSFQPFDVFFSANECRRVKTIMVGEFFAQTERKPNFFKARK